MTDTPPPRRFHGRRQGRRLRPHRAGLMETLLPRLRVPLPEPGGTLDWRSLFAFRPEALWLEIGFGAGEHLLWQARAHPQTAFIGCEPFINGMAALLAGIESDGLGNIRVHGDDALPLLDALPDGALDRVFLLFPDPWPKARHHARRFIQPESVATLARLLKPGAQLRVASDDAPLVDWMLFTIRGNPAFHWTARGPEDWRARPADWPETRYEAKRLHGPPAFLTFVRR
ncbi:MAG: tRNA (guanine(46)-N(7))-methyltransferase TrmB [Azospirillaceae bacterium]